MSRPRIIDAKDAAKSMRETFTDKKSKNRKSVPFTWPSKMQHVGQCLSVAYASDKWKTDGEYELYKHLHDGSSPNNALCTHNVLHFYDSQSERVPVIGPDISFSGVPMPREFAVLGLFEEVNLRLFVSGDDEHPKLGRGDDGIVKVMFKHAYLGGSVVRWSIDGEQGDQPFIFIYDKNGVYVIIFGNDLNVEKDGIVG
jgi:hypothetical protein